MIPIGDSAPRRMVPWVNYSLVFACCAAFVMELGLGPDLDLFIRVFGVTASDVTDWIVGDPRAPNTVPATFFTAMFLHAGWMHLLGNMLFLWIFGDNVEDRLGHFGYLAFYLVVGIGASLAQVAFDPSSGVPMIGASGAIAGILGAYLILYPKSWVTVLVPVLFILWPVSVPVVLVLGVWFITQLGSGVAAITEAGQATGGVGWWAHIGGFVIGALLINFVPKTAVSHYVSRSRLAAPGCPSVLRSILTVVGNVFVLVLIARLFAALMLAQSEGVVGTIVSLLVVLTNPLVMPFAEYLPAFRFGGGILELYTLLALLVYQLVVAALLWLLGLICSRPPAKTWVK